MSALLQLVASRGAGGSIFMTLSEDPPDHHANGLPYEADGSLAASATQDVLYHHQGMPFTVSGRVAVAGVVPDHFNSGSMPLALSGKLAILDTVTTAHHAHGVLYQEDSSVAWTDTAPTGGFSSGFSSGFEV